MRFSLLLTGCLLTITVFSQPKPQHNLVFNQLPQRWDEGLPLGNGWLGALIWQKGNNIRLSLDRVDLWDDRPMGDIDKLRFKWVMQQVKRNEYDTVQKLGDESYEKYAAPSKIPGAALEFNMASLGGVKQASVDISNGLSVVEFNNGTRFNNYIHATENIGYFGFENLADTSIIPQLIIPNYNSGNTGATGNSVEGQGLERLGYKKGTITRNGNTIRYHQPTWNGTYYEVLVTWKKFSSNHIIGAWTISNNQPAQLPALNTSSKEPTQWPSHVAWWMDYWQRSSVALPDSTLERQYYLEMYKFGCVARNNTPPISLQAVWTADNGSLPPWKGDYHHDLNTQLSYWPGYASNHLDLTASFTNWLWKVKEVNKRWTKKYFEVEGLNVPGVTSISGKEMGGWIQYSMSPSMGAWVADHFYMQWKYSMDKNFLTQRCLPYFSQIDTYFKNIHTKDAEGNYVLPMSSSPEFHDNSINAWFKYNTNFDLSLIHNFYKKYDDIVYGATGKKQPQVEQEEKKYAPLTINETGFAVAPGNNLEESHRHHSHLMSIYPLCLLNADNPKDKQVMLASLHTVEQHGTRAWVGYSFSWMASMYAHANLGDSAARYLHIFAENFCSPNSFHLNGDQKGGQYSDFTYRPFTLEGNFAFAQGIHEMLLQSYKGYIEIFPAIPSSWKDVSFNTLRTEGAFLVSAKKENAVPVSVKIFSEKGGVCRLKLPFKTFVQKGIERSSISFEENGVVSFKTKPGQTIVFENGYE